MSQPKELIVTWQDIHRDCYELAKKQKNRTWKKIIGISRGGLVPCAILARELSILHVETICISSYNYQKQGELVLIKGLENEDGSDCLVVDDLVDTGKTTKMIRNMLPKSKLVTVYAKELAKNLVDDYVKDVEQDVWIQLPWDLKLAYNAPLIKQS